MEQFCKVYETEELGQILVLCDENNDEGREEVRFFFDPEIDGVVVVSSGAVSSDVEGFCRKHLDACTEDKAINFVQILKQQMKEMLGS